jgi:aminopeptidase-like protein
MQTDVDILAVKRTAALPPHAECGHEMHTLIARLFPICRSITGDGVRTTLRILQEYLPLEVREVPSGTRVFDWIVPDEWNIRDAYVIDPIGNKIIDFNKSNLHVLGYSEPFRGTVSREELDRHLYSLPDQPDLIPYVTSYYKRRWGFCLSHRQRSNLPDGDYEVCVDSTLQPGSLTYAELIIRGETDDEILISTYICHPSMANNELSGPAVATFLAQHLLTWPRRRFTYRFVFVPETIGSITYLSKHLDHLKSHVRAGYVITCAGDPGSFSYLNTRLENQEVDRVTKHVLRNTVGEFIEYDFLARGSDERQYCAPGVDLPVGSLMRSKYAAYPEYHTSADNLEFVSPRALSESFGMYVRCLEALEHNHTYRVTVQCEPQMGRRGLYPTVSTKKSHDEVRAMSDLIAYCDGSCDLVAISDKINVPCWTLAPIAEKLRSHGLLEVVG